MQSVLQRGDRAGVVVLGSSARWLAPNIGRHQFYRLLDAILDAGEWHSHSTSALAPRAAVPPNAIVVAFSTLLNADFGLALTDLRRRGHPVVVVDVLDRLPFREEPDPIVARWWRLERSRMYRNIAVTGVDVVGWSHDSGLNHAMHLMPRRPRRGRRR
ncbi:putative secreted protein [Mycobacteroides abscessus subsp. abscessus]|nr:putative secreted protein [Mycobacteroides abscessus subsp. abscessus]